MEPIYDDGLPYSPQERRGGVRPWVVAVPVLALVGLGVYLLWQTQRGSATVIEKAGQFQMATPNWNGYQRLRPAAVPVETDTRYDALMKHLAALAREQEAQRQALEALRQEKEAAPAQSGQKPPPKLHMAMQHKTFTLATVAPAGPRQYVLSPGKKIACHVEPEVSSDTGSVFTARVLQPVFASDAPLVPVIPQNATIMGQYAGRTLIYGNQRLPTVALSLVLDGQPPVELGEAPITNGAGTAGLVSTVDHHFWRNMAAFFIQGVLRGGSRALTTAAATGAGADVVVGVGDSVAQGGQQILQQSIDTRPTIWVHHDEDCQVILTRELQLPAAY